MRRIDAALTRPDSIRSALDPGLMHFSPMDIVVIWVPFLILGLGNIALGNAISAHQYLLRRGIRHQGIRTWVAQRATASDNVLYFSALDFMHNDVRFRFDDINVNDSDETLSYVPSDAEHRLVNVWVDPADPRIAYCSERRPLKLTIKILVCAWLVFNVLMMVVFTDLVTRMHGALSLALVVLVMTAAGMIARQTLPGAFLWRTATPVVTSEPWHYVREFDERVLHR